MTYTYVFIIFAYISHVCVLGHFNYILLFAALWTITCQVPLSMGLSRKEYWSELLFPSPGHLPDSGIESASLKSPALTGGFFTTSATWKALYITYSCIHIHLQEYIHTVTGVKHWNFQTTG